MACPDEIEDIFVNDYIKEDGTREYSDLECLCGRYLVCARSFITGGEIQLRSLSKRVVAIEFRANEYDLHENNEQSRLSVQVSFVGEDNAWSYRASKENCDYLRDLVSKYIKPNFAV